MLRALNLSDSTITARVVAIQHAAYRIEADLMGFDGIPPLHESVLDLPLHDLDWTGTWDDGVLVGFIARRETPSECEIDRLAVHPAFHRRGHGRALVRTVLHHDRVSVSTGTKNVPALKLYESLGFRRVGLREIAPGVTVTELRRMLST